MSAIIRPYLHCYPKICETAFISENAVIIGDVVIEKEVSIWYGVVIRGDVNEIRIGARTNIQDGTIIHCTREKLGCYIGSDVIVGHGAILHACRLENGCFIGMRAIVMDGAIVESGAMVAAGSLVSPGKIVKSGEIWAGNPAKLLRLLRQEEKHSFPKQVAHYVTLGQDYKRDYF
jgi:carbonic anhydrase/acetyltransferase-like protein (isoleucine patch superfamily)